jgi:hypothetical protein
MNEQYSFTGGARKFSIGLMVLGLIGFIVGFATGNSYHAWANLLLGTYFTFGISIAGMFFVAANTIGYGGWYIVVRRVFEAIGSYIWIGGLLLLLYAALALAQVDGFTQIFEWADKEMIEEDYLLEHKKPFFNIAMLLHVLLIGGLVYFGRQIRNLSLASDLHEDLDYYNRTRKWAALYLVFFAVGSSTFSWHFAMSVDPHWYSTLYGWYNFASYFVACFAMTILIVLYLKSKGLLQRVNEEHLHDLGKYMFAFSIFWTYLWFSQYMLIWYAHIPEETGYFNKRLNEMPVAFFMNLGINFFFPFLVLMRRKAKRRPRLLGFAAVVVFLGHLLDFHLMIVPGASHGKGFYGITDVLAPFFFIGLLLFVVFTAISKAGLYPVNHPFWKESLQHHT